ncbi:MAG: HEAT repeat domain-containing protein [Saprospiraceae bacterium]|nr:HEAT repeat domain-containing protein [Saprospiraceae bacterium]
MISSCIPDVSDKSELLDVQFTDTTFQKIIDLGDQRDINSLYQYLRHKNPAYRYHAVVALGSIKNAESNDSIYPLLDDQNMQIRAAAAYAIGQSGDLKVARCS